MRELVDRTRVLRFLKELARAATSPGRVYLTGGSTAVLFGWRGNTLDIDLRFEPDSDALLRAIPRLKDELQVNVELASPNDFLPELPGWRERSLFIAQEGKLTCLHFDPYAQVLAKLERGHDKDLVDARALVASGRVESAELMRLFERIEPDLYRFPAISPAAFRRAVEAFVRSIAGPDLS
jgi:hypothetical protein